MSDPLFVVDIELTNRCNAKCYFCPRDQTPHQGVMSVEVFDQALAQALVLHRDAQIRINLCGLGEPLLNKHAVDCVAKVTAAGVECGISSNGALLDEERGRALLDAGLKRIFINVGDRDDDYEEVYKLPFEKTHDNVVRFAEMAKGRCEVFLVLVDYRRDQEHVAEMRTFWRERGITQFMEFEIMNRGGALFVDHMQYDALPERAAASAMLEAGDGQALCGVPFTSVFVGYDGIYYLCCSDWKKEVPLGSVFDRSIADLAGDKYAAVVTREPLCKTCNLDPLNRVTDVLRAIEDGEDEPEAAVTLVDWLLDVGRSLTAGLEQLEPGLTTRPVEVDSKPKRIPVRVE